MDCTTRHSASRATAHDDASASALRTSLQCVCADKRNKAVTSEREREAEKERDEERFKERNRGGGAETDRDRER